MEYILRVQRIVPLTPEEKEEGKKYRQYDAAYPIAPGISADTKTFEVLSVVLTEEEYEAAKDAIINVKK